MCVNDILTCGAEPLFFLDYFATGKLELDEAQAVIEGIAHGCLQAGCALIGGETAEMPGMYGDGEYDLAGFTVGAVEKSQVIDGSDIRQGHRLLGLASSGPHSNGYSLIRKVIEQSNKSLDDKLPNDEIADRTLGEALLAPTIIYVKTVQAMIRTGHVDGLAHITGGGLTENIVRVMPEHLGIRIDTASWSRPAVFKWLQDEGSISDSEMLRTFNCGIGMVLLVPQQQSKALQELASSINMNSYDLGEVVLANDGTRVHYD